MGQNTTTLSENIKTKRKYEELNKIAICVLGVETTQAKVLAIPKASQTQRGCNPNLGHVQTAATKNGLVFPLDSHVYLNSRERWSVQARLVVGGVATHR